MPKEERYLFLATLVAKLGKTCRGKPLRAI